MNVKSIQAAPLVFSLGRPLNCLIRVAVIASIRKDIQWINMRCIQRSPMSMQCIGLFKQALFTVNLRYSNFSQF